MVYLAQESVEEMDSPSLLQKATETLKTRINDYNYKIDVRQKPSNFSRKGILGFINTVVLTLNFCARSIQVEIDDFFEVIGKPELTVTSTGFIDARAKLKPEAFSVLLDDTVKLASNAHPLLKTYNGYRIFAIDGSIIILENTEALRGQFGVCGGEKGIASARLSTLTDVINSGIIMDVQLTKCSVGERESALCHHKKLESLGIADDSIILYDRGYISGQMVNDLNSKAIHYVFRLRKGWNKDIDELEIDTDKILGIKPNEIPLIVRIVKFQLDNGEIETLLVDPKLPADIFTFLNMQEIYFYRWGIESNYRVLKSELQIENFTGTNSLFIKQDVYATAVILNLTAFAKLESDEIIHGRTALKKNKYQQKTNLNLLIAQMKNRLICALLAVCPEESSRIIDDIVNKASRRTIPIRPGRSFPRIVRHRSKFSKCRKRAI